MKKLFLTTLSIILIPFAVSAETRIGISGAFSSFDTSGTETTKSSSQKNSGSRTEDVVVPGIFIEKTNNSGVAFGFEFNPGEAELGSGTGADDDAETSGANKASAEVSSHMSLYGLFPLGPAYFRFGFVHASIDTTETLATGTKYGNEDVDGKIFGLGLQKDLTNAFFRIEATYTDYDDVKYLGSLDSDSVRNTVEADVDSTAIKLSLGKSF
tara:strand:- start:887 stop:1522 length:636 start_codon:yes stop_codon:yes gene_type:complete